MFFQEHRKGVLALVHNNAQLAARIVDTDAQYARYVLMVPRVHILHEVQLLQNGSAINGARNLAGFQYDIREPIKLRGTNDAEATLSDGHLPLQIAKQNHP